MSAGIIKQDKRHTGRLNSLASVCAEVPGSEEESVFGRIKVAAGNGLHGTR